MQMKKMLKRKKCLSLKTFAVAILMVLFAIPAKAQVNTGDNYQVYMKEGNSTVASGATNVRFYDDHGPSAASTGTINYWDRWYVTDKHYTYVFRPKTAGEKIKVTFKKFNAYEWSDTEPNNCHDIGEFSLRINDDLLKVYNSDGAVEADLIAELTGTVENEFTFMADGPMTFEFISNEQYREEGWEAQVTAVSSMTVQAPLIRRNTCSNDILIIPTIPGATIYYTTDDTDPSIPTKDPLSAGILYNGPIEWPVGDNITIRAIAVLNGVASSVTAMTFVDPDDRIASMDDKAPTIAPVDGTNLVRITCPAVPEGMNETFYVSYTVADADAPDDIPTSTNGNKVFFVLGSSYEYPSNLGVTVHTNTFEFECTTPNTIIRARTFAYSCFELESPEAAPLTITSVLVDTPSITFSTTNQTTGAGQATIGNIMSGATVYYTTDGSTPSPTNGTAYTGPFAVTPGQTVKAIAHVATTGYVDSQVVSETYIPGGEGQSGAYGSVVVLDDREDHNWSYYSDATNPIHSLNPADVKITYYGNGKMYTSTGATPSGNLSDVTGVKVSASENEHTFIYLKTLERADGDAGTGNLAYKLIPNPFTVRPKFTLQGTSYYTGFYGWRVKRLNGVTINGNYTEGSIIPAETEIQFVTNNSEGNEVDFEAVWARAYVVTSNTSSGLSNAVGYERNFIYLSSNTTLERRGFDGYNVTYTTVDPATGSGTKRTLTFGTYSYNFFYCRGNTKFENAVLASRNDDTYLEANNHDLIVGRGVTGTVSRVYGIEGGSSSALDFTIRLESGTFNNLWLTDNGAESFSSTVSVRAVLGCDYDRAKPDNDKLSIAPTNSFIEGGGGSNVISSPDNRNNLTYDWYVKSGKIQANTSVNTGDPFYLAHYISGYDTDNAQYMGKRRLTIEGGEMGTVAGGCGNSGSNYSNYAVNDGSWTVMIRMKNGTVNGSVYGAAVYVGASGDRRMVFTGGKVKGWIAGGCNGTETQGGELYGDTYIYFGGKAKCDGTQTTQIGSSTAGNIFGAGSGNSSATGETATVGRVNNSNIVIADEAEVASNVYGGGNYGYVRVGTGNKSDIYVLGGTVSGSVFGGSNQQQGQIVNMWMKDGTVSGSLYGGSNTSGTVKGLATVNVSGGTVTNVYGGGFGASTNMAAGSVVNVSNGTINNNVYGGGELGTITGNTNVTVSGGTMKNVFGAGKGGSTTAEISGQTFVTVSGGTVSESVYGGGENGDVVSADSGSNTKNVVVTLTGNYNQSQANRRPRLVITSADGSLNQTIYWPRYATQSPSTTTVSVPCNSEITVTYVYNTSYYPSGLSYNIKSEDGTVTYVDQPTQPTSNNFVSKFTITSNEAPELASMVTINGGTVNGDVFGGGKMGKTDGSVTVNLFQGSIKGHLFGGAYGAQGSVYLGGQKTVNITGGHVFGNVYGGSRNANDANALTGYSTTEQATTCEINMSAGKIDQNLYGAGYFGHTYGSVNVYLGAEAISNAPNHTAIDETINYSREGGLNIEGTIYAGSDWGDFAGDFGDPTVSGMSNIYVDGSGYNSTSTSTGVANYMKAGLAILGCGTSCDAGTNDRTLIVRNYGTAVADAGNTANPYSTASRQLFSIQRFKKVIFDNAHLLFTGQGKVNSLSLTEKYGLYEDWTVYLTNGSTMMTNVPCSQIKSFQSVTCGNTYAATPSFTEVAIDGLGAAGSSTDNKIRVNGGSYIEIKYEADGVTTPYGELKGWAHMMSSTNNQEATCAYARPKQSQEQGNIIPESENNGNDGGFVSYDGIYNQYTTAGALVSTGMQDQIRYENHTPNMSKGDSQYFRIWRYGGNKSNIELVFDAHATGTDGYRTVDVTVTLPPFRSDNHYYRFQTTGEAPNRNTTTEYGSDVLTFNMACYNTMLDSDGVHGTPVTNGYMYYQNGQQLEKTAGDCPGKTDIDDNPDVNYGLVIMPNTSMVTGTNHIICDASDNYLAELDKPFKCGDNTQAPEFTFRLTYSNKLSSNMTWDPMKVTLVQCEADGTITDYVTLELVVVTSTSITQDFNTKVYAIMDGQGHLKDTYTSKIILPLYDVQTAGENSTFRVKAVSFTPDQYVDDNGVAITPPSGTNVVNNPISSDSYNKNSFGLAIEAADTYDNTNVWFSTGDRIDVAASTNPVGKEIGKESGRNEVGIDVILFYSGLERVNPETHMGTVTITVEFDNYKDTDDHIGELRIVVEIYRVGAGLNYYVDGEDGKDETGYGRHPDKPAATVNYIFNRCEYRPGGNIFVVNTVTVDKPETWNGARFNSVHIYRYPGVHEMSTGEYGDPETNPAFTGKLVEVTNELTLRGIVMDGMYAEATAANHDNTQNIYPSEQGCNFDGVATAPMINVADGGRINLKDGVVLQNNYNTTAAVTELSNPGGAMSVQYGGTARMNVDAEITGNINAVGGGVWVDGALIVSDDIRIFDNKIGTAATSRQSNVWLTEATEDQSKANVHYKVIQIGTSSTTDEYGSLAEEGNRKIGVDKEDWGHTIDGFMPVVYAEDGTQEWLELPFAQPQTVIVHDANIYELEKYFDDHYLYWIFTWVEKQNHVPTASEEDGGVEWDGIGNITTANQLAWVISLVNGENGCQPDDFTGKTVVLNNDVDMKAAIWVPIKNFKGKFEGNGHVVKGLNSPLMKDDMGMFGTTDGATIQNVIAKAEFNGDAANVGTLIGTMKGGSLNNVEAAGTLEGKTHTRNMGGLVGKVESGTIHSSFSVNDMTTSSSSTVMGGLVGTNGGDLYNSYANTTMTVTATGTLTNKIGGLVGVNDGHVENCYAVVGEQTFPAFANTNNGVITICYADNANGYVTTTGEGTTVELSKHGLYGTVQPDIKHVDYMYRDNLVTIVEGQENDYASHEENEYLGKHIVVWNGLLSVLNQWVNDGHTSYTNWHRPITTTLNGDLPILAFPLDNCVGNLNTAAADGKMLHYSAFNLYPEENETFNNGLDNLLGTVYKDQAANIFLYDDAIDVESTTGSNNLFINEDAVLLQKKADGASDVAPIRATVGITFDNSCKTATDYYGNTLAYDWHFMSSSLRKAPMGMEYGDPTGFGGAVNVNRMVNNYFPNGLPMGSGYNEGVKWDIYSYYEPQYHWINLKRSTNDHWHIDGSHDSIPASQYTNEDIFVPGKGYMMAISQDSYLCSTDTLNNGNVKITLTNQEPAYVENYNKGWNLVGNPFQAYLDLTKVGTGTYYIYDADQKVYAPVTDGQSTNPCIPSLYIHPHQGFFMYSSTDNNEITFDYAEGATTEKDNTSYFRGNRVNYPLVNLFAENQRGNRDLTVIELHRPELGGATKAMGMLNSRFHIAANLDGQNYGILFTPEGTERVPVHFKTEENGTYTLRWSMYNGDFSSLRLIDNKTGVNYDMLANDHYTFEATTEDYASRFYITYTCTSVDEEVTYESDNFAFFDGSEWVISGKGQLDVMDMTGRVLFTEHLNNEQNRVNLNGFAQGVYLMRVIDNKVVRTQKIIVR
jgi:hypothetical protein